MDDALQVDGFITFTLGIIVFFAGKSVNAAIAFLREYNIPEAVTGGIIASLLGLAVYKGTGKALNYNLEPRDLLLVYFFTTIGLNARLQDLLAGGRPLAILLTATIFYIFLQDTVGLLCAKALDLPAAMAVITGSASLIGGHGTAIAWASEISENHGVPNALEVGVASATLGLVMASLLGGPIAKVILNKHSLSSSIDDTERVVGVSEEQEDLATFGYESFLRALLFIHIAIVIGYAASLGIEDLGIKLPIFVPCLMVAIAMSNTVPKLFPAIPWPARTKSLALISDLSLALFISMSLMGMQLWSIADLAGPLLVILAVQAAVAVAFIFFIIFPMMGRDYLAAVISAGFAGFSLGSTPTAIANMTAVTKKYGPAPTAFIILPLVGAFFVDLTNAFAIQLFLGFS
ncbi:MAG: sodium/glutamate symporter [Pseudomonadota bacterium]